MTAEELITMDPAMFADVLQSLDAHACERKARAIVSMLEGSTFETYLQSIVDIVVSHAQTDEHELMPYFQQTQKAFPDVSPDSDILERLAGLTLLSVALRLEQCQK